MQTESSCFINNKNSSEKNGSKCITYEKVNYMWYYFFMRIMKYYISRMRVIVFSHLAIVNFINYVVIRSSTYSITGVLFFVKIKSPWHPQIFYPLKTLCTIRFKKLVFRPFFRLFPTLNFIIFGRNKSHNPIENAITS